MYVIVGATGRVGSRVADRLLTAGKRVRVISRSFDRLKNFMSRGAEPFAGDAADTEFLTRAFSGATAVFSMIPPNLGAAKLRAYQNEISGSISEALVETGVKHVVNLSSIGAQFAAKTGPILGLHDHEKRLDRIRALNVVHLRAAYFMENLLTNIDLIRSRGILGSALDGGVSLHMIAVDDVAEAAARLLIDLDFTGKSVRLLLGERDLTMKEAADIIGRAIGRPALTYAQFSYEDSRKAMVGMGISPDVARAFVEMSRGLNTGYINRGTRRTPERTTRTSFEDFAKEFARAYCADSPECAAAV